MQISLSKAFARQALHAEQCPSEVQSCFCVSEEWRDGQCYHSYPAVFCALGGCLSPGRRPLCCYKAVFLLLHTLSPTALEQNSIYCHISVHLISVHRTAISSTKLKLFMKGHNVSLSLCCLKRWQQKCISMALIFFGVFKNSVSPEIYRSLVQFL